MEPIVHMVSMIQDIHIEIMATTLKLQSYGPTILVQKTGEYFTIKFQILVKLLKCFLEIYCIFYLFWLSYLSKRKDYLTEVKKYELI